MNKMMNTEQYKQLKERGLLTQTRVDDQRVERILKQFDPNTGEPVEDAREMITLEQINGQITNLRGEITQLESQRDMAEAFLEQFKDNVAAIKGNIDYWKEVRADCKETIRNGKKGGTEK